MACYVYIIQSEKDGSYYKGSSEDPAKRLREHNEGGTFSTRHLIPWKLVYVEELTSRGEAMMREKNLKKATRDRIAALITLSKNIVHQFT